MKNYFYYPEILYDLLRSKEITGLLQSVPNQVSYTSLRDIALTKHVSILVTH